MQSNLTYYRHHFLIGRSIILLLNTNSKFQSEVLGISEETGSNERLTENEIKFWLLLLAFTTPYLITFLYGTRSVNIVLSAPVWSYGTLNYHPFRFIPLEMLIVELPFGLIRLVFIQQVLLYKRNLTDSGKLVTVGIFCELPGLILSYLFGILVPSFPFPLFLIVGLTFAKYTTKEPLSWIEKESSAH